MSLRVRQKTLRSTEEVPLPNPSTHTNEPHAHTDTCTGRAADVPKRLLWSLHPKTSKEIKRFNAEFEKIIRFQSILDKQLPNMKAAA